MARIDFFRRRIMTAKSRMVLNIIWYFATLAGVAPCLYEDFNSAYAKTYHRMKMGKPR